MVMAEHKVEARTSLEARDKKFFLDGKEIVLLSGAVHYWRIVPEYWKDRLLRLKACGLNCVETYVPWNWHEERRGEFSFSGMLDIRQFIKVADELGLYVIVRPGPYICSEWEFGGLPSWLLRDPTMEVRSSYQLYLDAADAYLNNLLPRLVDLQYSKGGPIIAWQLENEYGSYGNDLAYKKFLIDVYKKNGLTELFFTSDNGTGIQTGDFPGALVTANFQEQEHGYLMFEYLRNIKQPDAPLMVMEFWSGWFDHWGERHHVWPVSEFSKVLEWVLDQGSSVNFYMFHGGTNWGFMNGANEAQGATNEGVEPYSADVTSYDYDAPVAENGDLTEKWNVIRTAVLKRFPDKAPLPDPPEPIESTAYGTCNVVSYMNLENILKLTSSEIKSTKPLCMEELDINNEGGQGYGFILYRKRVASGTKLTLQDKVKDRAVVYLNNKEIGTVEPGEENQTLLLTNTAEDNVLDILVENMGRVNYASLMNDQRKGLRADVLLDGQQLKDWTIYPLEFQSKHIKSLSESSAWETHSPDVGGPGMYKVELNVQGPPKDTFVANQGWIKGNIFVNGFNLGRYWDKGPQKTLYLPGPLLKEGRNEILLFEVHRPGSNISFQSKASLGETVIHKTVIPYSAQLQIVFLKTALFFGNWVWNILRLVMK